MAANTEPIYTRVPDVQWGATALTTANTAKDGTGTVLTAFTADATEGGFVQKLRFRPAGTNVVTVARVFINNGASNATPANNIFYDDITLSAVTNSETAAQVMQELTLNIGLPPGYQILVTIGTTVASGWYVAVIGGKY